MKRLLFLVATSIAAFAYTPFCWADAVQSGASESTSSTTLNTLEVGVSSTAENSSERLERLSGQINQGVEAQQEPENGQEMPSLGEVLNLPPGMVVRGTRGGGLAIGTEY